MSEHFSNLRPSWIAFGWFIAAAITSLFLLVFISLGLATADSPTETLWVAVALLLGFLAAGVIVGMRIGAAPTLNGFAIGLFSLVVWLLLNLFVGETTGADSWRSLEPLTLSGLLALQAVAAVVGARIGVRWTRSSAPNP
jgi:hypothetical protein